MIKKYQSFLTSVTCALNGILIAIRTQRNMLIHLIATTLVISLAIFFSFSAIEWLFLWSAIFSVIVTELLNTAIENAINLITQESHPLAKSSKDIAAGAVLLSACYSLIVGYLLFYPRFVTLL